MGKNIESLELYKKSYDFYKEREEKGFMLLNLKSIVDLLEEICQIDNSYK